MACHFPDCMTNKMAKLYMAIFKIQVFDGDKTFEPGHDKTNKMSVCQGKTQISLGICPVWSESSLCTQSVAEDPMLLHADSKDSDQTGRMPRLIWVFAERTGHFVGFVMWRLILKKLFVWSFLRVRREKTCFPGFRPVKT